MEFSSVDQARLVQLAAEHESVADTYCELDDVDGIKFLAEIGGPWSWLIARYAVVAEDVRLLKLLKEKGCPQCLKTTTWSDCKDVEALKWLIQSTNPCDKCIVQARSRSCREWLRWIFRDY